MLKVTTIIIIKYSFIIGETICNIFYPTVDCLKITGGKFDLYLNYGEVKIFIPKWKIFKTRSLYIYSGK